MEQTVKRSIKRGIGIFLIVFGILGMILPILPGWWVGLIGLELLGWRLIIDRKKSWKEMIQIQDKESQNE